jgi:hypothetical protein
MGTFRHRTPAKPALGGLPKPLFRLFHDEVLSTPLPRTRLNNMLGRDTMGLEKMVRVIYLPRVKGLREERSTVREHQSLAEMANEVLMRQAKVWADWSGEPIEEAMEVVLNTEAGKQLSELRNGPHGEESVKEAQVSVARERAQERVEDLGKRLGETPMFPTHG